jgi:hypothetical protein
MQLSPLYLERLEVVRQEGEIKGYQDSVLHLLNRQVGEIHTDAVGIVTNRVKRCWDLKK